MRPSTARTAYLAPALACAAATGIATLLAPYFEPANIVMVFLLCVALVGMRWGRGPAVLAALLNVLAFDFFFVPPRFSFAVGDVQYVLTFAVMLAVGLITGQLTAGLRAQADVASQREARMRTLYELARELTGSLTREQVVEIAERFVGQAFTTQAAVLVPEADGRLAHGGSTVNASAWEPAGRAFALAARTGVPPETLERPPWLFIPLRAVMRTRGVLAIHAGQAVPPRAQALREYEAFAAVIAIALERVHYVDVARDALIKIESERLRNSLLAAISHDLRTPLAALLGLSEAMTLTHPPMSSEQVDIARTMGDETRRLIALVNNLLDMARIQSGEVKLDLQWHSLEEVVGSAIASSRAALGTRKVAVGIPRDLPLLQMDAVLMERVLANLLENAGKYTPPDAHVAIDARALGGGIEIAVEDDGPGIPAGQEEAVFEKFVRGAAESATPGVGLGLAICRAIVEAHHGTIRAEAARARGARFVIRLPSGEPPEVNAA